MGKDLWVIFRRDTTKRDDIAYEPSLLDRFPLTDYPDTKLEVQGISMLCFPRGMLLIEEPKLPTFLIFVLTNASGKECYGAALTFYEALKPAEEKNGAGGKGGILGAAMPAVFAPKVICILSHWPFFEGTA